MIATTPVDGTGQFQVTSLFKVSPHLPSQQRPEPNTLHITRGMLKAMGNEIQRKLAVTIVIQWHSIRCVNWFWLWRCCRFTPVNYSFRVAFGWVARQDQVRPIRWSLYCWLKNCWKCTQFCHNGKHIQNITQAKNICNVYYNNLVATECWIWID